MKNTSQIAANCLKEKIKTENSKICRICTRKGDDHKNILNDQQNDIIQFADKYLKILISRKEKFHQICSRCDKKLTEWHEFYEEIEESQKYFNEQERFELISTAEIIGGINVKQELDDQLEEFSVKAELKESESDNENYDFPANDVSELEVSELQQNDDLVKSKTSNNLALKKYGRDEAINSFFDFSCPQCSFKATNWTSYKKHLVQEHNETQNPIIICCDLRIPLDRRPLIAHVEYHTNPEKLRCNLCDKQFINIDSKRKHEYRHKQAREGNKKKERGQKYPCPECKKVLADKSSYKKHMLLHMSNEEREKLKVQCDLCKKFFREKTSLFAHLKDMHIPKEQPISCDQCAKVFNSRRTFYTHYRTNHTDVSRVTCSDCGAEMKASYLRKHIKLKHDHQAQPCEICFKEFRNRASLMIHKRRIHIDPKFSCDVCGKMFKVIDKFKDHRETHFTSNRFSCDQCDYINNDYPNMLKHRKTKHPDVPPLPPGTGRRIFEAR